MNSPPALPLPKPSFGAVKPLHVARDAGIVFVTTFIGGLIVGYIFAVAGKPQPEVVVAIVGWITQAVGFMVVGSLTVSNRWPHLVVVAIASWALSIVNLLFGVTLIGWIFGFFPTLLMMGVGGGLASLFYHEDP